MIVQPEIIQLPKITDPRGNLSYFQNNSFFPFCIARAYWIYDVPGGAIRGGHAFRQQREMIIALSGSFDVIINDGYSKTSFQLNRSYYALYIPKLLWRSIENFSTNSVALVLTDSLFNETDYIRDFGEFLRIKSKLDHEPY
jgi:hypothetical protein